MSSDVLEAIFDLRRALARGGTAAFAETAVGPRQVLVLRELRRAGSMSQIELSHATATDPVSVMRALDAFERRGWTTREACRGDRRRKLVSLTPAGQRALASLDSAYEALRALANGALSARERVQFCTMAARIAVALRQADAPRRPKA